MFGPAFFPCSEGIFSKHGGKMVLGFIGVIGLWFLRGHLGGKARDAVKDKVGLLPLRLPFLQLFKRVREISCQRQTSYGTKPQTSRRPRGVFFCASWSSRDWCLVNPPTHPAGCPASSLLSAQVEEECPLEPMEVEELRCSNDYPPDVFTQVLDSVRRAFPSGR